MITGVYATYHLVDNLEFYLTLWATEKKLFQPNINSSSWIFSMISEITQICTSV